MIIFAVGNRSYQTALSRFESSENIITKIKAEDILTIQQSFPELIENKTPIMVFGLAGSNKISIGTEVYVSECIMLGDCNKSWKLEKPSNSDAPTTGVRCYTSDHFVTETDISEPVIFDRVLAYLLQDGFNIVSSWRIISDNLSREQLDGYKSGN